VIQSQAPKVPRALSGSWDKTLKLWDVASGRELRTFTGHARVVESVTFSPDGARALSGSADDTLKLWDHSPGTPRADLCRMAAGWLSAAKLFIYGRGRHIADGVLLIQSGISFFLRVLAEIGVHIA
jgi:WD40 repeat protein